MKATTITHIPTHNKPIYGPNKGAPSGVVIETLRVSGIKEEKMSRKDA